MSVTQTTDAPLPEAIPLSKWAQDFQQEADRLELAATVLHQRAKLYRSIARRLTRVGASKRAERIIR